jgi:uncharacterized protein (DUF433 family)
MATEAPAKTRAPIERTEHPHIVKSADTLGGMPRIEDTRIPVVQVFDMVVGGISVDEIVSGFPILTRAQIHDAVSYGYDHPDEMEENRERQKLRNIMKKYDMVYVNSFLIPRELIKPSDIPEGATVYTWETLPLQEDE